MKTIELKNALPLFIFYHEMLYALLEKSFNNVNNKISNLVKSRELVRLKKGFYTFSKPYLTRHIDLLSVVNTLYTPSYVSFNYALSYYGRYLRESVKLHLLQVKMRNFLIHL